MKEAILRTLVPVVYALLLKSGVTDWLGLGTAWAQNVATLIATGTLYVVLRWLEAHRAWVGWLLGYPAAPKYHR